MPFKLDPSQWPQVLAVVVIVIGFAIMLMRDALAEIPLARSGVAVLTGLALVFLYLTKNRKDKIPSCASPIPAPRGGVLRLGELRQL